MRLGNAHLAALAGGHFALQSESVSAVSTSTKEHPFSAAL